MKSILFATTALVATAGIASAQGVELTGEAKIGILGGDYGVDESEDTFLTDIDVKFLMSGEADNGLTFGANVDLDEAIGDGGDATDVNEEHGGAAFFLAFGPARLDMGDVDGALDAALFEVGYGSTLRDEHTEHAGFNGNAGMDGVYDGQVATFSYAFAGFTGYLSAEVPNGTPGDPIWGIGASYSADLVGLTFDFGLGYQTGDSDVADASFATTAADISADILAGVDPLTAVLDNAAHERKDIFGLSVATTFGNGIQAGINYSQASYGDEDDARAAYGVATLDIETETHIGIGLGYTMNALTVGVNWGQYDNRFGVEDLTASGYGLAVNYDLGGGLTAEFGYGYSKFDLDNDDLGIDDDFEADEYSLGLRMAF